jgi:hypothetical protein
MQMVREQAAVSKLVTGGAVSKSGLSCVIQQLVVCMRMCTHITSNTSYIGLILLLFPRPKFLSLLARGFPSWHLDPVRISNAFPAQ